MILQRFFIVGYGSDTLQDIKGDACKAVLVEVDFLVIWDLTEFAEWRHVSKKLFLALVKSVIRYQAPEVQKGHGGRIVPLLRCAE